MHTFLQALNKIAQLITLVECIQIKGQIFNLELFIDFCFCFFSVSLICSPLSIDIILLLLYRHTIERSSVNKTAYAKLVNKILFHKKTTLESLRLRARVCVCAARIQTHAHSFTRIIVIDKINKYVLFNSLYHLEISHPESSM